MTASPKRPAHTQRFNDAPTSARSSSPMPTPDLSRRGRVGRHQRIITTPQAEPAEEHQPVGRAAKLGSSIIDAATPTT